MLNFGTLYSLEFLVIDKLVSVEQEAEAEVRAKLQKEVDDTKTRANLEQSTLTENLTTLRSDLLTAQKQTQDFEKMNDEIQAEKLGIVLLCDV